MTRLKRHRIEPLRGRQHGSEILHHVQQVQFRAKLTSHRRAVDDGVIGLTAEVGWYTDLFDLDMHDPLPGSG